MVKIEQILLKMQTAQSLRWQDPELAQVFARSALEDAQVTEALRLDPFHPGGTMLSANLARRLRAALRSGLRAVDDPAIPRLYSLLAEGGETTFSCHVTMIRYAIVTGQTGRAVTLAEAVVTLYPEESQAWSILAEAARAAGNELRAGEAEFHLGVLDLRPGFRAPRWEKA